MGRPSIAAEKRRQIAAALLSCMKTAPYYEVSTRDIARAAQIPPSLVYHYFDSKKAILLELLRIENELFTETRTAWIAESADTITDVDSLIAFYMNRMTEVFDDRHYDYLIAYSSIWSIGTYDEDVRKITADFYLESRDAHAELLRRFLVDPEAAEELAMLIIDTMDSYVFARNVFNLNTESFLSMHRRFLQIFRLYTCHFPE